MITRFPGLTPTRSRAVATDDLVVTVAVAPDPAAPSVYGQSVQVLARIDALRCAAPTRAGFSRRSSTSPT